MRIIWQNNTFSLSTQSIFTVWPSFASFLPVCAFDPNLSEERKLFVYRSIRAIPTVRGWVHDSENIPFIVIAVDIHYAAYLASLLPTQTFDPNLSEEREVYV